MVIVRGIGIALRAIAIVLMLLTGIIYVGAIVFRGLLEGTALGTIWFRDVPTAMGTLMLDCTLSGSRGTHLIREAYKESAAFAGLLLAFVLLSNVTMMGVLAGLLVQTVKTVAEAEKEEKTLKDLVSTMDTLWAWALKHDEDKSGTIDEMEFRNMIGFKETAKILRRMNVDVEGLVSVASFVFQQHEGKLDKKNFMNMVLDLRGSQKATVKDHMESRKHLHAELESLRSQRKSDDFAKDTFAPLTV